MDTANWRYRTIRDDRGLVAKLRTYPLALVSTPSHFAELAKTRPSNTKVVDLVRASEFHGGPIASAAV